MGVSSIAKLCKRSDPPKSTERAFRGRQYEKWARRIYRNKRYRILATNLRKKWGEIDILARDPQGVLVVVEVRGRRGSSYSPVNALTNSKINTLKKLARRVAFQNNSRTRIEFIEIIGEPPSFWTRLGHGLGLPVPVPRTRIYEINDC